MFGWWPGSLQFEKCLLGKGREETVLSDVVGSAIRVGNVGSVLWLMVTLLQIMARTQSSGRAYGQQVSNFHSSSLGQREMKLIPRKEHEAQG